MKRRLEAAVAARWERVHVEQWSSMEGSSCMEEEMEMEEGEME